MRHKYASMHSCTKEASAAWVLIKGKPVESLEAEEMGAHCWAWFALNSLRTVALAPLLPPCLLGDTYAHVMLADVHPEQGCCPLHLTFRRRQASHALGMTFLALVIRVVDMGCNAHITDVSNTRRYGMLPAGAGQDRNLRRERGQALKVGGDYLSILNTT
jgi:hypothetical protein